MNVNNAAAPTNTVRIPSENAEDLCCGSDSVGPAVISGNCNDTTIKKKQKKTTNLTVQKESEEIFRRKYDSTNVKNASGVKEETLFPFQRPQSQFELDFYVSRCQLSLSQQKLADSANESLPPFSGHAAPRPPLLSWTDPPRVCVPGPPARFRWSATQVESGWKPFPSTSHRTSEQELQELSLLVKRLPASGSTAYRQDLVPLLQPAVQSCSSIFFDFGHINARVIFHILLINTSNYVESQTWKNERQFKGSWEKSCWSDVLLKDRSHHRSVD